MTDRPAVPEGVADWIVDVTDTAIHRQRTAHKCGGLLTADELEFALWAAQSIGAVVAERDRLGQRNLFWKDRLEAMQGALGKTVQERDDKRDERDAALALAGEMREALDVAAETLETIRKASRILAIVRIAGNRAAAIRDLLERTK